MNDQKQKNSARPGFTLLEVVFAIGIITIGMTSVASLVVMNIQAQNVSKNYLVASMLAQEGLELVRNIRDTNWLISEYDWKLGAGDGLTNDIVLDGTYTIDVRANSASRVAESIADTEAKLYLKDGYYVHDNVGSAATPYARLITVNDQGDWVEVKATVRWHNRGRANDYEAITYLYDWK